MKTWALPVFLEAELSSFWKNFFNTAGVNFSPDPRSEFSLIAREGLFVLRKNPDLEFFIDFFEQKLTYQKKIQAPRKDLLARAVGLKSEGLRVVDLTAGLAQDAFFMARLGCQVQALERHPLLYFLLQNAWDKLPEEMQKSIRFEFKDALDFFKGGAIQADVIYYDPMYPDRKKSALPRKEMQVFRALVGADEDCVDVLELALQSSVPRVVLKRPHWSSVLELPSGRKPSHSLDGNLIRYDVYLKT